MDIPTKFTRSDAERSWPEFVAWIGFSTLSKALKRKHSSLEEWASFREIAPKLFSIEIGLAKVLQRWRTTRKLSFPKEKSTYDALAFAGLCTRIKSQLSKQQAEIFRRRVISDILPNGRLCHLDHEFRIAQNLFDHGWTIKHFGFCGEPGPDFIAQRGANEIEVEGKCLSPEIGLGISYEYSTRLLSRINRDLRGKYPGQFTTIKIEIFRDEEQNNKIDTVRQSAIDSYASATGCSSDTFRIVIEFSPLRDFLSRFPTVEGQNWLHDTFAELRTREGDYGYFMRRANEVIFCNIIPMRPSKQLKNVLKLISKTCGRQFSGTRPSVLWLHLQGLDPKQVDNNVNGTPYLFRRLAQHTFRSDSRNHLTAITFSSDTDIDVGRLPFGNKDARVVSSIGKVRGFDNPRCRFGQIPVFAPRFHTLLPLSD